MEDAEVGRLGHGPILARLPWGVPDLDRRRKVRGGPDDGAGERAKRGERKDKGEDESDPWTHYVGLHARGECGGIARVVSRRGATPFLGRSAAAGNEIRPRSRNFTDSSFLLGQFRFDDAHRPPRPLAESQIKHHRQ